MKPKMHRKTISIFFTALVFLSLGPSNALSSERPRQSSVNKIPFSENEELTYKLTWLGVFAGMAKLCIKGKIIKWDKDLYHITSQADSSKFVSLIYKVEDRINSFIDASGLYPWYYSIKQREGRYRARRKIIFDQKNNRATFIKNDNEPKEFSVPPGVQDPISSLYFIRGRDLTTGKSVYVNTFSGKKTHRVEVQIIKKEKIDTMFGKTDTVLIRPILNFHGIFRHKGKIFIWLTDDNKRLPVKMRAEIFIGSVVATLIDYKT